jgi:hypothetical protein
VRPQPDGTARRGDVSGEPSSDGRRSASVAAARPERWLGARTLRTGEERIDIPHGPEQPELTETPDS